jgi:hypothetical protein
MRFEPLWKDESGQALVIATLSMAVLMGFLALAVDVGLLFHARRNVQLAADSAAVAAALDYKYNANVTSAQTAGRAAAAANGISNVTANVSVNVPPTNGPYTGNSNFAEVLIQQPMTTTFTNFLNIRGLRIAGRAVAGSLPLNQAGEGCMWALASSGQAVSNTGSGDISASNCNIYDDSSASNAVSSTGSGMISAKAIGVVGGFSSTPSGHILPNPPTTGITPVANPLNITAPTVTTSPCMGGSTACDKSNSVGTMTLSPGNYTSISTSGSARTVLNPGTYVIGSLSIVGSGTLILGAGNYTITGSFMSSGSPTVTLGSGLYIIGGGLSLTGSGPLTGTGVTFDMQGGGTTITGSSSMSLTAPTSGNYSGLLIYQPSTNSSSIAITGSAGATFQGIVDAPSAPLRLTGSGSLGISTDLIVSSITNTGSGTITNTNYAAVTNTNSVLNKIRMVE